MRCSSAKGETSPPLLEVRGEVISRSAAQRAQRATRAEGRSHRDPRTRRRSLRQKIHRSPRAPSRSGSNGLACATPAGRRPRDALKWLRDHGSGRTVRGAHDQSPRFGKRPRWEKQRISSTTRSTGRDPRSTRSSSSGPWALPRSARVGPGLQVGADDGADAAEQDPDPRRPYGPLTRGAPRAGQVGGVTVSRRPCTTRRLNRKDIRGHIVIVHRPATYTAIVGPPRARAGTKPVQDAEEGSFGTPVSTGGERCIAVQPGVSIAWPRVVINWVQAAADIEGSATVVAVLGSGHGAFAPELYRADERALLELEGYARSPREPIESIQASKQVVQPASVRVNIPTSLGPPVTSTHSENAPGDGDTE